MELPVRDFATWWTLQDKKKRGDFKLKELETLKLVPFLGKQYHWWYGKGKEIEKRRKRKR